MSGPRRIGSIVAGCVGVVCLAAAGCAEIDLESEDPGYDDYEIGNVDPSPIEGLSELPGEEEDGPAFPNSAVERGDSDLVVLPIGNTDEQPVPDLDQYPDEGGDDEPSFPGSAAGERDTRLTELP